jgi:hypothetical protein
MLWYNVSGGQLTREDSNSSISLELYGSGDKTDSSSHIPKIKVGVNNTVLAEMKARQEKRTSSPRQVYILFVKIKLSQFLFNPCVLKLCGRVEVKLHTFLTLPLDGILFCMLQPMPQYPLTSRLDVPKNHSGHFGEEKYLCMYPELNPGYPAHSLITILTK